MLALEWILLGLWLKHLPREQKICGLNPTCTMVFFFLFCFVGFFVVVVLLVWFVVVVESYQLLKI